MEKSGIGVGRGFGRWGNNDNQNDNQLAEDLDGGATPICARFPWLSRWWVYPSTPTTAQAQQLPSEQELDALEAHKASLEEQLKNIEARIKELKGSLNK